MEQVNQFASSLDLVAVTRTAFPRDRTAKSLSIPQLKLPRSVVKTLEVGEPHEL